MAAQNHFLLFISLLIAPIAAKQGAHNKLNTRNEYAAAGVYPLESKLHIS